MDELPMSVRSELAEARAVADRCRRLEAELRDRERDLDAAREQVTTLRAKLAESEAGAAAGDGEEEPLLRPLKAAAPTQLRAWRGERP